MSAYCVGLDIRVACDVSRSAKLVANGGCLCIGCLEKRLGHRLQPKDFLRGHPFNLPHVPGTPRLMNRRGRPSMIGESGT
jgi:hypothetical protein